MDQLATFPCPLHPRDVSAFYALDKKERLGLAERVIIVRLAYADGSVGGLK